MLQADWPFHHRPSTFQRKTGLPMHIVVIAWLWVILMMAITERSVVAGVLTFVFYGLAPCMLLLWLIASQRKFMRQQREAQAALATGLVAESSSQQQVESGDRQDAAGDKQDLQ